MIKGKTTTAEYAAIKYKNLSKIHKINKKETIHVNPFTQRKTNKNKRKGEDMSQGRHSSKKSK